MYEIIISSPWQIADIVIYYITVTLILMMALFLNMKPKLSEVVICVLMGLFNITTLFFVKQDLLFQTLCITIALWVCVLILFTKRHLMENLISGCMAFTLVVSYTLIVNLINATRHLHGRVGSSLMLLSVFSLIALIYVLLFTKKTTMFKENGIVTFFTVEEKKLRYNRYALTGVFLLTNIFTMITIYVASSGTKSYDYYIYMVLSIVLGYMFLYQLKVIVEYGVLQDDHIRSVKYSDDLEEFMKIIRGQRHDFNLHLYALKSLIDNKQYEECNKYIKTISDSSEKINEILPLKNSVFAAMLNGFREIAKGYNIELNIEVLYSMEDTNITTYDLNVILGNLIQNAIDEINIKNLESDIDILITKEVNMTVLEVSNRYQGLIDLEQIFSKNFTTKKHHDGIGLKNALRIVSKNNGILYPEIDEDVIKFIVKIPNKIN